MLTSRVLAAKEAAEPLLGGVPATPPEAKAQGVRPDARLVHFALIASFCTARQMEGQGPGRKPRGWEETSTGLPPTRLVQASAGAGVPAGLGEQTGDFPWGSQMTGACLGRAWPISQRRTSFETSTGRSI